LAEGEEGESSLPAPLAHAEAVAVLKILGKVPAPQLSEATLYTTVEPCLMCAYLIRRSRIGKVVYGTVTEGAGGVSSRYPILTAPDISGWGNPPEVVGGILEEECRALLTKRMP
jgi:tRNA(adenine34) deaminase